MADVDFGHIITQDEAVVPDSYEVDANVHIITLDGAAIAVTTLATDLFLLDAGEVGAVVTPLRAGVDIVNHGGATKAEIDAAILKLARARGLTGTGGAGGSKARSGENAGADLSSAPDATPLVDGQFTPTE